MFSVSKENFKMWRNKKITGSKFEDIHCRQIMEVIRSYSCGAWISAAVKEVTKNKTQRFNTLL